MKKIIFFILPMLFYPFLIFAEQIDINTATFEQLDQLTGIGPTYAQRIIDGRPYPSIDDLLGVKGIGEKTLQKIKEQGFACVDCQPEATELLPVQINTENEEEVNNDPKVFIVEYPKGVFLNEILPSPQGADDSEEWIEIFNSNNFDVDLSGWQIKDSVGTVVIFIIPTGTKIFPNGYLVFTRPETNIILNNNEDGLFLLYPDGEIADSVSFQKSPTGQSYNKISSEWQWSQTITKGTKNIISPNTNKVLLKTEKSVNNIETGLIEKNFGLSINQEKNLSAIQESSTNPWFLFLAAIILTIISAIVVLFIKLKLSKTNVRT
jgi:hypothetical protein